MEKERKRTEQYRLTTEGKQKHRDQSRRYLRVHRHIDAVLKEVMGEDEILSLTEISLKIFVAKKVKLRPSTVENRMEYYREHFGQNPLDKIDEDRYKLNFSYYETFKEKKYK